MLVTVMPISTSICSMQPLGIHPLLPRSGFAEYISCLAIGIPLDIWYTQTDFLNECERSRETYAYVAKKYSVPVIRYKTAVHSSSSLLSAALLLSLSS